MVSSNRTYVNPMALLLRLQGIMHKHAEEARHADAALDMQALAVAVNGGGSGGRTTPTSPTRRQRAGRR